MSDVSAVTKLLAKANEGFVTTTGGTVSSGATSVSLTSATGLTNGSTFVGLIEPGTSNEQAFTGTVDTGGSQITGVKWTKGTNTSHAAGTTIVDYVTSTFMNMLTKWAAVQHNDDGTHSAVTASSVSTTTLTVNGADYSTIMPAGMVAPYAGSSAPSSWLICDGSAVSRTTYSRLYVAIGTTFGIGDGSSTFNIPDLRGKALVGYDAGQTEFNAIGKTGGEKTHVLTTAELAVHSHGVNDPGHSHDLLGGVHAGGGGVDWDVNGSAANRSVNLNWSDGTRTGGSGVGVSIQNAGSNTAHNNLQPYLSLNHIIKT